MGGRPLSGDRLAWLALALLLLAIVGGAALYPGPATGPALGAETTFAMAAASLAADHDLRLEGRDRDRFKATWGWPGEGVEVLEGTDRLAAPAVSSGLLAPFVRLAPHRGLFVGAALALALAAWVAARVGSRQAGAAAAGLVVLALAGSVAFHAPFRIGPWCVLAALTAGALGLARAGAPRTAGGPPQIFEGDLAGPSTRTLVRFAVAGLLLGLAAADDLPLAALLWPAAAAAPERGRGRAVAALFGCAGFALAGVVALVGAPWTAPTPVADLTLLGWNLLDFLVGRHAGVLVWFLPVLLFATGAGHERGRAAIPAAVALAALVRLVLYPFDWAGSEVGPAALPFLPLYAALWLWPARAVSRLAAAAVVVVAGLGLWPLWLAPRAGVPDLASGRGPIREVLGHLPIESALRRLPGSSELEQAGARVRSVGAGVWESTSGLQMMGTAEGRLLVASARRLTTVRLDFGGRAPSRIEVVGARAGNTTFRPGGGVAFDLILDRPARRHPTWWSDAPVCFYPLRIRFPGGPPSPLPFSMSMARPAVPDGGSTP